MPVEKAMVAYSLSVLENAGIAEKVGQGSFAISEHAKEQLDNLVKKNNGNRSMACLELVFDMLAKGENNALPLGMLDLHWRVLHLLAFNEEPLKKDVED